MYNQHLKTGQIHTEDTKCNIAGVQRCGVVADRAFIHPLQVESGSEDGQWKVPVDEIISVPTEAFLYLRCRFFEWGDVRAVSHPADCDERLVYFVPRCRPRERHITGQGCICIWAGLYFTWRHCVSRERKFKWREYKEPLLNSSQWCFFLQHMWESVT